MNKTNTQGNNNGHLDQPRDTSDADNTIDNCFQGLRLAVAIAIIRTKPLGETGAEYAKQLYNLINGRCKENQKESERLDSILNSLSNSINEIPNGLNQGDELVKKETKLTNTVKHRSNGQMQLVMSVASLNKFSKTLTDQLDGSIPHKNCETISFALISDCISNVFEATNQYLTLNKSGVAAKAGLKQVAKIASKLEIFCLQNCCEPVYKALLNCILSKTSELLGNVQQFIIESTLLKDYSQIPDHLETLSILSQSASLFVTIIKLLVGCISAIANQFSSNIFSSNGDVTSSHLSVYLFTNVGYLLQALNGYISSMTVVVSVLKEQDLQKRAKSVPVETIGDVKNRSKADGGSKRGVKRKKVNSKKGKKSTGSNAYTSSINNNKTNSDSKVLNVICPSLQMALVIQGDGDYFPSILDSLKCVSSLIERAPMFAMFVMKCRFEVEKLRDVISDIIKKF